MAVEAGCIARSSFGPKFVMFVSSAFAVIPKTSEGFDGLRWVVFVLFCFLPTPGIIYCGRSKGSNVFGRT